MIFWSSVGSRDLLFHQLTASIADENPSDVTQAEMFMDEVMF